MKILSAKYVLPISSELISEGAVAIEKDKIVAVGSIEKLSKKFQNVENTDFGEAVIMPGFVNCHSHLEITAMRGFLDEFDDDFSSWLVTLTKTRAETLTDEDIETAAMLGTLEGVKAGVTCFADIGRFGKAGFKALQQNGLRGILFQETEFSPDNKTAKEDFEKLKEKFLNLKQNENDLVKIGISPHAPYTVSRELFERIIDYAIQENIKISIHSAESEEEQSLMQNGTGFFAEIYEKQAINWEIPYSSTIEYFSKIGVLDAKPLLAHCVKVSEKDLHLIAESGASIALCPKSNAKFGHGIAPFKKFLDNEIKVGFGSDSMASNNTCDILEEARFATLLARTKGDFIHSKELLEVATIGGAKSLGLEKSIGTLEVGKQADIIAVSLENISQMPVSDVQNALVFASSGKDVIFTMVAGEELYKNRVVTKVDEVEIKAKIREISTKMTKQV